MQNGSANWPTSESAFNARFFNPKTNKYESETQGSYVFPLAFGLVPEDHRAAVVENLVDEIQIKHKSTRRLDWWGCNGSCKR